MMRHLIVLCCTLLLSSIVLRANENSFTFLVKGNLTTGSQLFPNPNASSAAERARFVPIDDIFGYSVELRYQLPESELAFGLSIDYIRSTSSQDFSIPPRNIITVDDGYRVIPVELTAYFIIPVSGPTVGVYMGGGGGAYFGRRIYRVAGVEAPTVDVGTGFGIHVLGGVTYRFNERFSLSGEMKFRDLQFETSNAFSVPQITFEGAAINVSQRPFNSRVHTNGMILQLAASVSF